MTAPTLAWFEIATADADRAERFYGDLFGWTFAPHPGSAAAGVDYRVTAAPGADGPMGGIVATGGALPDHAVFGIAVADVDEVCTRIAELGGTVVDQQAEAPGVPAFAYLRDPDGSLFQVFTPPTA